MHVHQAFSRLTSLQKLGLYRDISCAGCYVSPYEYEYEYDIYSLYKHMADINGPEKHYIGY